MCKLSVVMSVYNAGQFLRETVDSILTQSMPDFEFIIIDDGSTDGSGATLAAFAARDPRIRLVSRENRGLVASLNEGCQMARSDYIVRMDADDVAHPERFARQYQFMEEHPQVLGSGCEVLLIDADGAPIKAMGTAGEHAQIDGEHMAGLGGAIIHPSAIVRKDALTQVGFYSEDYPCAEDLDLWLRIAEVGELANLDQVLLSYRQHPGSIGAASREKQYRSAKAAVRAAHQRRGMTFDESRFPAPHANPSAQDLYKKWGWWALKSRYLPTARKYAWRSLRNAPMDKAAWKLVYCTLRGR